MKERRHSHHTPDGRKASPLGIVKVVEPTEDGLLITYYPVKKTPNGRKS